MPTSHYKQIPDIIDGFLRVKPKSVFEVGVGCGKYGILLREYLEVWDHYFEPWGSVKIDLEGIEIHELYSDSPGWRAYDLVTIGDVREHVFDREYDMILAVDVMEHFTRTEAKQLVAKFLEYAPVVLIGMPAHFFPTEEVWDNPHEVHKCELSLRELGKLGTTELIRNDDALVVLVRRK